MDPERARLFFALWPDDSVREALSNAALRVKAECGGRATPAAKIHLTLVFLGDVEKRRIAELAGCAARVAAPHFDLAIDVLGYWRHNRIVWAGTRAAPAALARLAADLSGSLAALGYRFDDRPYVPHVTLVRNARQPSRIRDIETPSWHVRELVLAQSAQDRYDVVGRWPLEASL
jgi:2'-5' RNA ligase